GIPVYANFRRSSVTGWNVAIGLPREFIDDPLLRARLLAFGGGTAVLALSLVLGWWMARAIRQPVKALTAATKALRRGEAMGQLTGGVAHDFNNLLTAISGSLTLLEPRVSDAKSLRLLHTAQRGASQGALLTESLLAFARKQRLTPIPADLNSIIVGMSEILRHSIGPTIEIRQALATDLWPVLIDVGQIETALLNIALNARDAIPGGGVILIETANMGAVREELPEEVAEQDCVLVSIRDTGTGMSPEVLERAFEPFFTTKEIGKGT